MKVYSLKEGVVLIVVYELIGGAPGDVGGASAEVIVAAHVGRMVDDEGIRGGTNGKENGGEDGEHGGRGARADAGREIELGKKEGRRASAGVGDGGEEGERAEGGPGYIKHIALVWTEAMRCVPCKAHGHPIPRPTSGSGRTSDVPGEESEGAGA